MAMSSFKAQGSNLVHSLARKASIPYFSLFHFHYYAPVASLPFWLLRWAPSPPSHASLEGGHAYTYMYDVRTQCE